MGGMDWLLEIFLVGLLAVTLLHAIRLQRALGGLHQDRAALGDAVTGFDSSTKQAEAGLQRLQAMATTAAQQVSARAEHASALKDDLLLLSQRAEQTADRLEGLIRAARTMAVAGAAAPEPPKSMNTEGTPKVRSQAERDLLLALRGGQ